MSETPVNCDHCHVSLLANSASLCNFSKRGHNHLFVPGPQCPFMRLDAANAESERLRALVIGSADNEATEYPWWAICKSAGFAGEVVLAGPFFSRGSAEMQRINGIHRYGKKSYVFCFSGHESHDYKNLRQALAGDSHA